MLRDILDKRTIVLSAAGLAGVAVLALMPQLFRDQVGEALVALEDASTGWLWVAAAAFIAALFCSASAWRAATKLPDRLDAYARYAMSETNVEQAIAGGERQEDVRAWCRDTLGVFFGDQPREILFDGCVAYIRRA